MKILIKKNYKRHYYKSKPKKKGKAFMPKNEKRKAKKIEISCHKCGKIGHYANQCWTKKSLNEIEDEQLRSQLKKIMLVNSEEEVEFSNEENFELVEETSLGEEEFDKSNNNCQCNELSNKLSYWKFIVDMHGLNVLNADQEKALTIIESIKNSNLKEKMLKTLIKDKNESPLIIEAPYQLSEVLHVKETPVSINDLKREINLLKSEIFQIKQKNEALSTRMKLLETKSLKLKKIQDVASSSNNEKDIDSISNTDIKGYLNLLDQVTSQK